MKDKTTVGCMKIHGNIGATVVKLPSWHGAGNYAMYRVVTKGDLRNFGNTKLDGINVQFRDIARNSAK